MNTTKEEDDLVSVLFKALTYPHTMDSFLLKQPIDTFHYAIKKFARNYRGEMVMQYPIFYLYKMQDYWVLGIPDEENLGIAIEKFKSLEDLVLSCIEYHPIQVGFIRIK